MQHDEHELYGTNKQTNEPAGQIVEAAFFQRYSVLFRIWVAMLSTEAVVTAFRHVMGWPMGMLDAISWLFEMVVVGGLLFSLQRRGTWGAKRLVLLGTVLTLVSDVIVLALRLASSEAWVAAGTITHMVSVVTLMAPLLYVVMLDTRFYQSTEQRLTYLVNHDLLTGLPNRKMFEEKVMAQLQSIVPGKVTALLFIDLDRFKNVNDTFGHSFGDQLIVDTARRLQEFMGDHVLIARPSGDEFMVLLPNIDHADIATTLSQQLIQQLSQTYQIHGHEVRIGCSIGIALYPEAGEDAVTLIKNADIAMYRAKELGKNGYQLYTPDMNDAVIHKLVMEEWLNKALENNEFILYYQPQIDLSKKCVIGMEALIRWKHPSLGMIPPNQFIPLSEETGLIVPIGEWVLRTACKQNKEWQEAGLPPVKVAVNISPLQFHQSNFVDTVLGALQDSGLDPQYLELEITEGIAMFHVEQAIQKLAVLREHGIDISIDDFGTGYSSLVYLKKFPIQRLKIAQQFVRDITLDPDDAAIVQAVVAMANSLKLNVIAEGVETREQLTFLTGMNCNEVQGYLYSRPLPVAEIRDFLLKEVS